MHARSVTACISPSHSVNESPAAGFPVASLPSQGNQPALTLALAHLFRLVLETLTPLPGDRKCFRMINGVLTERTVSDILPALQTNADGLKKVLEDLVKQYRNKQEEMEKWKVRVVHFGASMSTEFVRCGY
jgi:hypothetical protein